MFHICGREKEIKLLQKILYSEEPQFLAIYGRRRVGKTYLIENFFRDKGIFFQFIGSKGASLKEQLKTFRMEISEQLAVDQKVPSFKSWSDAFYYLRNIVNKLDLSQKKILFFDEIPWIATAKSGFLQSLEYFWNQTFSKNSKAILVVCGSAASWMIKKIIYNKGGLYNRLTEQIRLEPFTLKETEQYLNFKHIFLNRKQIVDLYMVTGGVAKYLNYVEKGISAAQNIQNICFSKSAPLLTEYKRLFGSLFDNSEDHIKIVQALAKKRTGLTHTELLIETKRKSGGRFTLVLEELKEAGFIDFIPSWNKKKKEGKFYLSDEYTFFFITWLKNLYESSLQDLSDNYWFAIQGSAKYAAWSGFAFETLCRKNIKKIIQALKIEVVAISAVHWSHNPKQSKEPKVQIDLIIDRRDNCMNLCEIKFHKQEIVFTPEDAKKVYFRKERFIEISKTKKTLFNTLISVYGAKKNAAFFEAFDNEITLDDWFV